MGTGHYWVHCSNAMHKDRRLIHGGALLAWLAAHAECDGRFAWGAPTVGWWVDDIDEVVDWWAEQAGQFGEGTARSD